MSLKELYEDYKENTDYTDEEIAGEIFSSDDNYNNADKTSGQRVWNDPQDILNEIKRLK